MISLVESKNKNKLILYHSSPTQNLKRLNLEHNVSNIDMFDTKRWIYAANDPKIASAFTFRWDDQMGITFGSKDFSSPTKHTAYIMGVPSKLINLLQYQCSMYTIEPSTFTLVGDRGLLGEYRSSSDNIKILTEKKFKSARECMEFYGVKIKII